MEIKRYVCGFLFNNAMDKVVLISKNKPEWQAGKLNGVGGKIEGNESEYKAMVREFKEEADMTVYGWKPLAVLVGDNSSYVDGGGPYEVHFFWHKDERVSQFQNFTSDEGDVAAWETLPHTDERIANLNFLIPYAFCVSNGFCASGAVIEETQ